MRKPVTRDQQNQVNQQLTLSAAVERYSAYALSQYYQFNHIDKDNTVDALNALLDVIYLKEPNLALFDVTERPIVSLTDINKMLDKMIGHQDKFSFVRAILQFHEETNQLARLFADKFLSEHVDSSLDNFNHAHTHLRIWLTQYHQLQIPLQAEEKLLTDEFYDNNGLLLFEELVYSVDRAKVFVQYIVNQILFLEQHRESFMRFLILGANDEEVDFVIEILQALNNKYIINCLLNTTQEVVKFERLIKSVRVIDLLKKLKKDILLEYLDQTNAQFGTPVEGRSGGSMLQGSFFCRVFEKAFKGKKEDEQSGGGTCGGTLKSGKNHLRNQRHNARLASANKLSQYRADRLKRRI